MSYSYTWFGRTKRYFFRELPNFFKNIWKFRKALWNHYWWDYNGILEFLKIGVEDMAKNFEKKGLEVKNTKIKKIEKMNRVVEILTNIQEDRYFDIIEERLGKKYNYKDIKFEPSKENPELFEMVDYSSEEDKKFTNKFFNEVSKLQEDEWNELWDIIKGQNISSFEQTNDFKNFFDGSDLRGWWD